MYADWLKAHRLTFHREGVRDKAKERCEATKAQQVKLQAIAQLAAADVLAREQAVEQATVEEKKLSDQLEERKRGAEDNADDYEMGEGYTWISL